MQLSVEDLHNLAHRQINTVMERILRDTRVNTEGGGRWRRWREDVEDSWRIRGGFVEDVTQLQAIRDEGSQFGFQAAVLEDTADVYRLEDCLELEGEKDEEGVEESGERRAGEGETVGAGEAVGIFVAERVV